MSVSILTTNLRVTGSPIIYQPILSGIGGTKVIQSGNFILISGGAGSGGGGAGDVTYAQLLETSGALQSQINNINLNSGDYERILSTPIPTGVESYFVNWSPDLLSNPLIVLSTLEVTGFSLLSLNVKNITKSGYTALFSDFINESGVMVHTYARSAPISSYERILNTLIPTGVENYFINWTPNLTNSPSMIQATLQVAGTNLYGLNIKGRTISGYLAVFSEIITETGVYVNTYAR